MIRKSVTPAATRPDTICASTGRPRTAIMGFGRSSVSSRMRVPRPAASKTALVTMRKDLDRIDRIYRIGFGQSDDSGQSGVLKILLIPLILSPSSSRRARDLGARFAREFPDAAERFLDLWQRRRVAAADVALAAGPKRVARH